MKPSKSVELAFLKSSTEWENKCPNANIKNTPPEKHWEQSIKNIFSVNDWCINGIPQEATDIHNNITENINFVSSRPFIPVTR